MTYLLIKYGPYAAIVTGMLLLVSAVERSKPESKWYFRLALGAMGIFVLYVSIRRLLSK